jgi:hypothetical protein
MSPPGREQFHSAIIDEHVSLLEPATCDRLANLPQYFMSHGSQLTQKILTF